MVSFTLRKLAALVGTMLGIAALTFLITNVAPGDPARLVAGPNATEDMVETIRVQNGLDKPVATVTFTLDAGAKREVKVGANAEGSSRWVQATGHDELLSISSWAADWATAEPKKFQKAEEKKADDKAEGTSSKKASAAPAPAAPADPHAGHGH